MGEGQPLPYPTGVDATRAETRGPIDPGPAWPSPNPAVVTVTEAYMSGPNKHGADHPPLDPTHTAASGAGTPGCPSPLRAAGSPAKSAASA
jgi:hypothetical protein